MVERVVLVHSDRGRPVDGIRDYCTRLADELPRHSVRGELRTWPEVGEWGADSAIVLQYSPFCFARWGFAPRLPAWALATKARRGASVALMVHEPFVSMETWRTTAMGLWQRAQLGALRLGADVVFTSIDTWAERLQGAPGGPEVRHLPVGSNLPDRRDRRQEARAELGAEEGTIVLATIGREHPSWLGAYVVAAANAVAATGQPTVLLALGAEAPPLPGLDPAIAVHAPGYLEASELSAQLAAADIFLAPLVDGVSTRRGTLMAALQHGLAVLGTEGPLSDRVLRESGEALRLTPVGDKSEFADAAAALAVDPPARGAMGAAARGLYERRFDWPVIAGEMLAALPDRR